jgi:hypothetical protein
MVMQRFIHIKAILFPGLILCAVSQAQIDSVAHPDSLALSTPDSVGNPPNQKTADKKNLNPVTAGILSAILPEPARCTMANM